MLIRDAKVTYPVILNFTCNASWMTISKVGTTLFDRKPYQDNWYDAKHKRLVDAIRELEEAIKDISLMSEG